MSKYPDNLHERVLMSDTKPDDYAQLQQRIRVQATYLADDKESNLPRATRILLRECDDAIERQSAEIARLQDDVRRRSKLYNELDERAEAAESQVRQLKDRDARWQTEMDAACANVLKLTTEVRQLQEALREIDGLAVAHVAGAIGKAQQIARDALSLHESNTKP